MKTFTAAQLIVAMALGGCASEAVTRSSLGGAFPSAGMTADLAQKNADAQCAKYGKRGRITSIEAKAPAQVLFECK